MIILAIDSTAASGSVAICRDEKLLCEFTLNIGNTHSETLLPMVESALKMCGMTASDIDLFACDEGPGSFTGVRIGAATIKGLAFNSGKPCIGVSTLEALAYNLSGFEGIACPVMNARRDQVYNALFDVNNGEVKRICEDRALAISELEDELLKLNAPVYLSGDGYDISLEGFKSLKCKNTPEMLRYQSGYSVAVCALKKYNAGTRTTDSELTATYLRLPQAERERLEKEKANNIKI